MTGNRAAVTLVILALLGPVAAIAMTLLVDSSPSFAEDSWAHGRLDELWILCLIWAAVCVLGAWTQWGRDE